MHRALTRALPDVLDLSSATDMEQKGGTFSYRRGSSLRCPAHAPCAEACPLPRSVADLDDAFAVLPPRAALLQAPAPREMCTWVCYTQFRKLNQCLDLVKQAEQESYFRYDFVFRQRPDMFLDQPYPHVSTLKRAAYAGLVPHGVGDMYGLAHRDHADGLFGATQFLSMAVQRGCDLPVPEFEAFERSICKGPSCECWMKVSLHLRNATLVSNSAALARAHVVRMREAQP